MPVVKQCVVAWTRDNTVVGDQVMVPVQCTEVEHMLAVIVHKLANGGELEWFEQAIVDTITKNIDSPALALEVRRMW